MFHHNHHGNRQFEKYGLRNIIQAFVLNKSRFHPWNNAAPPLLETQGFISVCRVQNGEIANLELQGFIVLKQSLTIHVWCIYHKIQQNVGKYTIHGFYGNGFFEGDGYCVDIRYGDFTLVLLWMVLCTAVSSQDLYNQKNHRKPLFFGGEFTSDDGFCVAASFQMFEAAEDTQNQRWRRKWSMIHDDPCIIFQYFTCHYIGHGFIHKFLLLYVHPC